MRIKGEVMRINQIVDNDYHSILEDKAFIRQFSLLLSLIIAISLFLIYYSVNRMDHLSMPSFEKAHAKSLSLGEVEKELNGNVISLEVLEDNFSDLAQMDLQELERQSKEQHMVSSKNMQKETSRSVKAAKYSIAVQKRHSAVTEAKRPLIQITSSPVRSNKSYSRSKSIKTLRKKFYTTNDIKYALQIAEKLKGAGKYKAALKWSLIANEIAPESAKSWMLFATIKQKMGKKRDAINVLSAYLKTYDSVKVAKLLKKIKSS
jgi:tetratricopeptide (TPR) repeat protein